MLEQRLPLGAQRLLQACEANRTLSSEQIWRRPKPTGLTWSHRSAVNVGIAVMVGEDRQREEAQHSLHAGGGK